MQKAPSRHFAPDYSEKDVLETWHDKHVKEATGKCADLWSEFRRWFLYGDQ